MKIKERNFNVC